MNTFPDMHLFPHLGSLLFPFRCFHQHQLPHSIVLLFFKADSAQVEDSRRVILSEKN